MVRRQELHRDRRGNRRRRGSPTGAAAVAAATGTGTGTRCAGGRRATAGCTRTGTATGHDRDGHHPVPDEVRPHRVRAGTSARRGLRRTRCTGNATRAGRGAGGAAGPERVVAHPWWPGSTRYATVDAGRTGRCAGRCGAGRWHRSVAAAGPRRRGGRRRGRERRAGRGVTGVTGGCGAAGRAGDGATEAAGLVRRRALPAQAERPAAGSRPQPVRPARLGALGTGRPGAPGRDAVVRGAAVRFAGRHRAATRCWRSCRWPFAPFDGVAAGRRLGRERVTQLADDGRFDGGRCALDELSELVEFGDDLLA